MANMFKKLLIVVKHTPYEMYLQVGGTFVEWIASAAMYL
jgi:hypothetical protein